MLSGLIERVVDKLGLQKLVSIIFFVSCVFYAPIFLVAPIIIIFWIIPFNDVAHLMMEGWFCIIKNTEKYLPEALENIGITEKFSELLILIFFLILPFVFIAISVLVIAIVAMMVAKFFGESIKNYRDSYNHSLRYLYVKALSNWFEANREKNLHKLEISHIYEQNKYFMEQCEKVKNGEHYYLPGSDFNELINMSDHERMTKILEKSQSIYQEVKSNQSFIEKPCPKSFIMEVTIFFAVILFVGLVWKLVRLVL
ncbi:hypothetical protein [Marinobacter salexigens]|uniref:hypothetical protein n=1 Tax=Marinobacter salexigens TaxID=1925763 RepID=UPI000C287AB5|nr:hypothetical protein [Marinobacter salexigens]